MLFWSKKGMKVIISLKDNSIVMRTRLDDLHAPKGSKFMK